MAKFQNQAVGIEHPEEVARRGAWYVDMSTGKVVRRLEPRPNISNENTPASAGPRQRR